MNGHRINRSASAAATTMPRIAQPTASSPPVRRCRTAWLPISLAVFQQAGPSTIFLIFATAIWPVILNTAAGDPFALGRRNLGEQRGRARGGRGNCALGQPAVPDAVQVRPPAHDPVIGRDPVAAQVLVIAGVHRLVKVANEASE